MSSADHSEWSARLHGFVDGELDSVHAAEFEAHLVNCDDCRAELERVKATRTLLGRPDIKWRAPEELRRQVAAALARETRVAAPVARNWRRMLRLVGQWSLAPSLVALAASLFLFFNAPVTDLGLQDEIVASHVRSLLADHLADVRTSNQHTVKPWFNGKIDFAPPVVDLATTGYPLIGGRVDYLDNRVVAALVYRRGAHIINLFVWPRAGQPSGASAHDGYNLREWSSGGLAYWAISDIPAIDLDNFRKEFITAAASEVEKNVAPK